MGRRRLFNDTEKWCNKCQKWLPLDAFGDNIRTVSKKQDYCRTCHSTFAPTFWQKYDIYQRKLQNEYGLSPGEYLEIWRFQDKKCAICGCSLVLYDRATTVDHDHVTGKVRGLLCSLCNVGLGNFKDVPDFLRTAALYLETAESGIQRLLTRLRHGPEQMVLELNP